MRLLKQFFDNLSSGFDSNGRFHRFKALFTATRTFFLFPSPQVIKAPYIRDSLDSKRFMSFVIIALLPVTLFGMFNTGYQANFLSGASQGVFATFLTGASHVMPIILVSYGVGFFWEILFAVIRRHEITEGFLVTGLLLPLTLPASIPLWQVALGISFGVVIGKEVFGGTGRNILNPALTARAFLFFSYPGAMSGNQVWIPHANTVDAFSGATPLAVTGSEGQIADLVQQAGYSLQTLFFGLYPGSIGGTSAMLCFAGALFLMITRIASFRIILGGIAGLVITALLFQWLPGPENSWFSAGPVLHLLAGGFALGICFMATDPVSAPGTDPGRWIYGFFIGALTVILRAVNPAYVEGVMLAILFMNIFAPLMDHIIVQSLVKKRIPNV